MCAGELLEKKYTGGPGGCNFPTTPRKLSVACSREKYADGANKESLHTARNVDEEALLG